MIMFTEVVRQHMLYWEVNLQRVSKALKVVLCCSYGVTELIVF